MSYSPLSSAVKAAPPRLISKRTMELQKKIAGIRNGPLSFKVDENIKTIELRFARRNRDYGARYFLKEAIPSLLYQNPSLHFKLDRPGRVENATLKVDYADGKTTTLDLKMKSSDEILRDFTSLMKGVMPASASTAPTQKSSEAGSQDDSTTSTSEEAATRRASEEAQTVPPPGEVEQGVDVGTARA